MKSRSIKHDIQFEYLYSAKIHLLLLPISQFGSLWFCRYLYSAIMCLQSVCRKRRNSGWPSWFPAWTTLPCYSRFNGTRDTTWRSRHAIWKACRNPPSSSSSCLRNQTSQVHACPPWQTLDLLEFAVFFILQTGDSQSKDIDIQVKSSP